jgi:hypothetical protein
LATGNDVGFYWIDQATGSGQELLARQNRAGFWIGEDATSLAGPTFVGVQSISNTAFGIVWNRLTSQFPGTCYASNNADADVVIQNERATTDTFC